MSSRVFELFVLPCQLLMLLIWIAEQSKHLPLFNLIFFLKSINLIFFINEVHYIFFFFNFYFIWASFSCQGSWISHSHYQLPAASVWWEVLSACEMAIHGVRWSPGNQKFEQVLTYFFVVVVALVFEMFLFFGLCCYHFVSCIPLKSQPWGVILFCVYVIKWTYSGKRVIPF